MRRALCLYASVPLCLYASMPLETYPDRLRLQIPVERLAPQIASEAGCLEPAERGARIVEVVAVDPDRARANRPRGAVRLLDVPGPDPGGEAVHRLIGEAHAVVEVVERQHGEHRPKDLLAGNGHLGLDAVEHRRLDVVAFAVWLHGLAASDQLRAFEATVFDRVEPEMTIAREEIFG